MSQLFCPTCANLLTVEQSTGENVLACATCPYVYYIKKPITKRVALTKKEKEDILGGEEEWVQFPKTDVTCPKCSNGEARYQEIQTRSADEPATLFFRCTQCANVWKEG